MTLTQTAILTKRLLVISIIALVLIITGTAANNYYQAYQRSKIPPTEEQPDLKFGILPHPNLPPIAVASSDYGYSLDTVTGGLPENLPKLIKVYFIPQLGTTLLASERAKIMAEGLGFTIGPENLSETERRFQDSEGGQLIMNLDSGNFKFTRKIATPSGQVTTIADQPKLVADLKQFLASKDLLKPQLVSGRSKVAFDTISMWQDDVDGLPTETSSYTTGLIRAVASKNLSDKQKYLSLDYNFWLIDQTNFATYPLKKAEVAFEELQAGLGTIVIKPTGSRVSITSVYLAYLLTEEYSPYLQPIYVFEGEGFVAYVSAIPDQYLEK